MDQDSVLTSLSRIVFQSEKREKVAETLAEFITAQVAQQVRRAQEDHSSIRVAETAGDRAPAMAEPAHSNSAERPNLEPADTERARKRRPAQPEDDVAQEVRRPVGPARGGYDNGGLHAAPASKKGGGSKQHSVTKTES
jgi:hypothetical protein